MVRERHPLRDQAGHASDPVCRYNAHAARSLTAAGRLVIKLIGELI